MGHTDPNSQNITVHEDFLMNEENVFPELQYNQKPSIVV